MPERSNVRSKIQVKLECGKIVTAQYNTKQRDAHSKVCKICTFTSNKSKYLKPSHAESISDSVSNSYLTNNNKRIGKIKKEIRNFTMLTD
jgi:hypothetical protein